MRKVAVLVLTVGVAALAAVLYMQHRSSVQPVAEISGNASSPHAGHDFGQMGSYAGTVVETMNAGGYTYVFVDTGAEKIWAAGPETIVSVGDKVSFAPGMIMTDFRSESLDRTFESVQFVDAINTGESAVMMPSGHPPIASPPGAADEDYSGIDVPSGGKSIADIYAQRDQLVGKTVVVRGKVVKFTGGVMGKNWIHLKDGTGGDGTNDLTVTSDGIAKVGDVITVTGQVGTDKDFGFGYEYDVIIEDADVAIDT